MSEASAAADGSEFTGHGRPRIPCPVLEFRIVNRLFSEVGGEIMDASLNVVANINANDAEPSFRHALEGNKGTNGGSDSIPTSHNSVISGDANSDEVSTHDSTRSYDSMHRASIARFLGPLGLALARSDHQTVDEDPSARFVNKHIFSKMMIEASEHPFFRRVWVVRHVLDSHSPILKDKVRRLIRRHGEFWPEKLNNANAIRESLQFNQILVSLNGVSNISASDVYAQKI